MAREKNPFVSIGASLTGILMVMLVFVVLFAEQQAWVLAPIAAAIAVMGIALGYFASKGRR